MNLAQEFLSSTIKRLEEYKHLGDKTFAQLEDKDLLVAPNEVSNSIAVIIQHLHGNMMSRWTNFLQEDGEKSWRNRDAEFEEHSYSKTELLALWEEGWKNVLDTLHSLKQEDLLRTITIRNQPLLVVDAIQRQVVHYGGHVGQIVYLGRWIRGKEWQSLSIPKGRSSQYNEALKKA